MQQDQNQQQQQQQQQQNQEGQQDLDVSREQAEQVAGGAIKKSDADQAAQRA